MRAHTSTLSPPVSPTRALSLSLSLSLATSPTHILQERFPELGAVSEYMVRTWAHANEVPARPNRRVGLLNGVARDSYEGRYILDMAATTRDTWEEIRAQLVVRHRARRERSATK